MLVSLTAGLDGGERGQVGDDAQAVEDRERAAQKRQAAPARRGARARPQQDRGGGGAAGTPSTGSDVAGAAGGSGLVVVRYVLEESPGSDPVAAAGSSLSQFGCGDTEVWICNRALNKPLAQIGFTRAEWGRELSELSTCSLDIPEAWCSPLTSDAVDGGIETWKYGLMVFRDGVQQWRGPIVDITRPPGSEVVSIQARDKMAWTDRRFLEVALDYELIDDATMFDLLIREAVRRDNRFRLSSASRASGSAAKRSYPANGTTSILSLIEELRERTARMERDIYNLKEVRSTLAQERNE